MQTEFIEKRRVKKDSAVVRALRKIMPPMANVGMTLVDVIAAEAKDLRDAQHLATTIHTPLCLHLTDDAPRQMYRDRVQLIKPQVHAGQLKLFLSELRFLTEFARDSEKQVRVVYAGAAPGIHLPYLANLFPRVNFFLYDPREFCDEVFRTKNLYVIGANIYNRHGVRFNQSCANIMNNERRDPLGNYVWYPKPYKLLFISDIRSGDSEDPNCDFEKCCESDMEAQMNWIRTMRPAASMVKFRLPYKPGVTGYLAPIDESHLWFGVFAPRGSTELRLVTGSGCEMRKYDHTKIEEQAYYFNNFTRVAQYGSSRSHPKKTELGMDNCWDCCAMREICYSYLCQKYDVDGHSPLPENVIAAIELTAPVLPCLAIIISDYCCMVAENELWDFIAVVVRECKAGDKLHAPPHGGNSKCEPWCNKVYPNGFALEPRDPKMLSGRVENEIRRLYESATVAGGADEVCNFIGGK